MKHRDVLTRPPRTIMELYKALPQGTLAELIDNAIYMSPSPITEHQRILNKINHQIFDHFEKSKIGEVFISPLDVYLDEQSNAVQPDIIVVLKENFRIIHPQGHINGIPDLLIEILSPGNKEYDLVKKKDLYESFGVKEYWIVDPLTKLCIVYDLTAGKYILKGEATGIINSSILQMVVSI